MECGFIRVEERMMAGRFGPAYAQYRSHVRRWI
jgi:protein-S-isoprenylcysteine O-methyltransferase Ste14